MVSGERGETATQGLTVSPCFIAVKDDLETLEVPGLGTVEELSRAHRRLEPPGRYPSGFAPKYQNLPGRFHVATELCGLGALSDALVGRRGWDSPQVLHDVAIVLGEPQAAEQYFQNWR